MKYLIAILLPKSIGRNVSTIQGKYNNGQWHIALPPHITLVPPMVVEKPLAEISKMVNESIKNTKQFDIELQDIGYFANKHYVIYQEAKITPELLNLANNLNESCQKIAKEIKKYDKFVAHVTLSNDLDKPEFEHRYEKIKKEISRRTFKCEQIALLSREPNRDKWKIEKLFQLDK